MNDETIEIVIEIQAGSRNKYEIDSASGKLSLERQLPTSLVYPADYGFVPKTLSRDGDPLDALLLIDEPTVPGCTVEVSPLGVLWLQDEEGDDPKIVSVLPERAEREGLHDVADLPQRLLDEIEHFFDTYKDLEPNAGSKAGGFGHRNDALRVIAECRARHDDCSEEREGNRT